MRCPACQLEVAGNQRFCGSCGAALLPRSELPTLEPPVPAAAGAPGPWPERRSPGKTRGFTPGTLLAGRYRVVGLLGRGGMGEVYRADDLKLGTPVALKFLPRALAGDQDLRERFLSEVRLARQIAHPNVCRVFDIEETLPDGGEHFLTMEYVDGEDLASLLRRIGRLPADKALDIARQICAGLAAAHERDVLHRDLKPANIMLDGRGRVRLMDFGLAVAVDAAPLDGDRSGTPPYMSPEQLAGASASIHSDIYALGLVIYELYTGKPAYAAESLDEMRKRKEQELLRAPTEIIPDLDPAVERVILRALACDPRARPATVPLIAASLPGGSLLDAALRAGDTPSPEMVAASGSNEALSPPIAWAILAVVAAALMAAILVSPRALLWRRAMPERSPEVFADEARRLLAALGHSGATGDRAAGFEADLDQLRYLHARDPSGWRSATFEPGFLRFWYRDSPRPLEAWRFPFLYGNVSRITRADPPLDLAGMSLVRLDPRGRLTDLLIVPSATTQAAGPVAAPDWTGLLTHAGLDPTAWRPALPERNPPVYADARAAWVGTWPETPAVPVRFEAAALGGKPVYFEAIYPWTPPPRTPIPVLTDAEGVTLAAAFVLAAAILVTAAVLARRNLRAGRGDRRGAFRLAVFVWTTMLLSWLFGESHVPTLWEVGLVAMALSWALLTAAVAWLAYLAVEPFLRRRWPQVLVGWTRLVSGEVADPLVGQDVLAGVVAGVLLALVAYLQFLLPEPLGAPSSLVFVDVYGVVFGVQAVVPFLLWRAAQSVVAGLAGVLSLLMLRLALRSQGVAVAAFAIGGPALGLVGTPDWIQMAITAIHFGVFALLLVRFGLLAAVVQFYVWGLLLFFPITLDFAAWYAGAGMVALLVLAALTVFGLTTAVAGRNRSRSRLLAGL